jgi:hypothetical protein
LKQEIFTKFFFPNQAKVDAGDNLESDSDDNSVNGGRNAAGQSDGFTHDSTSVSSNVNKNRDIANKLKGMEK